MKKKGDAAVIPEKDPVAVAMVQKRWANTTEAQRREVARKMLEARWGKKGTKKAGKKAK